MPGRPLDAALERFGGVYMVESGQEQGLSVLFRRRLKNKE